jgi:hypothetical protein
MFENESTIELKMSYSLTDGGPGNKEDSLTKFAKKFSMQIE